MEDILEKICESLIDINKSLKDLGKSVKELKKEEVDSWGF